MPVPIPIPIAVQTPKPNANSKNLTNPNRRAPVQMDLRCLYSLVHTSSAIHRPPYPSYQAPAILLLPLSTNDLHRLRPQRLLTTLSHNPLSRPPSLNPLSLDLPSLRNQILPTSKNNDNLTCTHTRTYMHIHAQSHVHAVKARIYVRHNGYWAIPHTEILSTRPTSR